MGTIIAIIIIFFVFMNLSKNKKAADERAAKAKAAMAQAAGEAKKKTAAAMERKYTPVTYEAEDPTYAMATDHWSTTAYSQPEAPKNSTAYDTKHWGEQQSTQAYNLPASSAYGAGAMGQIQANVGGSGSNAMGGSLGGMSTMMPGSRQGSLSGSMSGSMMSGSLSGSMEGVGSMEGRASGEGQCPPDHWHLSSPGNLRANTGGSAASDRFYGSLGGGSAEGLSDAEVAVRSAAKRSGEALAAVRASRAIADKPMIVSGVIMAEILKRPAFGVAPRRR